MKDRGEASPDVADSLALTFAMPVKSAEEEMGPTERKLWELYQGGRPRGSWMAR